MELQRNDPENGIEEKENWSGEYDLTLLFGSTEISAENCNRESFLLFSCTEISIENCTNLVIYTHIFLYINQLFKPKKTYNKMHKLVIKMRNSNQNNYQI